tara:strand:+ start:116 stop:1120 length:1005 start_codon:yes stop_codon:yes gene_type:complete
MINTNSTYPNEVIFVKQQNSFNLPKEETEYLVEKRNDFDEIEKLGKFFPVKDGTLELKIISPEYSKSYKHGDIYNISKKKSGGFSEVEQIVGTGIILNNIYKRNKDSLSIFGSRGQSDKVNIAIHCLKRNTEQLASKEKSVLESYTQGDLNLHNPKGSGFFSLSCGKASDNLDYNFGEDFYLEVYLDDESFRDILSKIYHTKFEAIIVRCNLGSLKGIYAEKPTGVYTENGFITDGQAYKLLYEKSDVSNYTEMPDNFGSVGAISKGNPFIVDVYYASKDLNKVKSNKAKSALRDQRQILEKLQFIGSNNKVNILVLYTLMFIILLYLSVQFFE